MKSTKKSLIMSMLSMLLCVTMLMGTTFAWFTDTVTSGKNRIVAGNLDVEMFYKNALTSKDKEGDAQWDNIKNVFDGDDKFFVDANGDKILWEPGVVSVCDFEVRNVGTLALKYKFNTEFKDGNDANSNKKLSSVIKAAVVDANAVFNTREDAIAAGNAAPDGFQNLAIFANEGVLAPKGKQLANYASDDKDDIDAFKVILYWEPTENDNDYNMNNEKQDAAHDNTMWIDIDIKLIATQLTEEKDSFDFNYDEDATYPGNTASDATLTFDSDNPTIVTGIEDETAETVIIPATATKIADNAFKNNKSIKEITMPVNVEIGEGAFEGCDNLEKVKVVIPDGETAKIDTKAFACCPSLKTVEINGDASIAQYGFYCDYDNAWDSLDIVFNGNVELFGGTFAQNGTVLGDSTVTFNGDVTIHTESGNGNYPNATFIFSSIEEIRFAAGKKVIINGNCTNDVKALKRIVFEGAPAEGSDISANAFAGAKGDMEGVYIGSCTLAEWGDLGLPTHFNGEYWAGGDVIVGLPE